MNVDFTLILCINEYFIQDLIPGPVYKINITACVEDINKVVIESKPLHEKITVTDGGKLSIFREEPDRERRHSVLARQMSTAGPELTPWRNWAIVAELITDNDCVCILHDSMSGINVYIWYIHIINCQLFSSSSAAKNWGTQYVRVSVLKRYLIHTKIFYWSWNTKSNLDLFLTKLFLISSQATFGFGEFPELFHIIFPRSPGWSPHRHPPSDQ